MGHTSENLRNVVFLGHSDSGKTSLVESILHQSGLGALFLMAKPKIHPLWWSEFIPILFFVSSIYAGLAMIIIEGTVSHRVFSKLIPEKIKVGLPRSRRTCST